MSSIRRRSDRRFPCQENPTKCYLSSSHNVRLSACRNGTLVSRNKRSVLEEFVLLPCTDGEIMLKTAKWDKFLAVEPLPDNGGFAVKASPIDAAAPSKEAGEPQPDQQPDVSKFKWRMIKGQSCGTFLLISACTDLHLVVDSSKVSSGAIALSESGSTCWSMEYLSGELLFVSFPKVDRRLRCDVFGVLSLSENTKGWEVWRFIEEDDNTGNVRIKSWMHNRYLCSDETGNVSSVADPGINAGTVWVMDKAPKGTEGVILRSVVYDRILCVKESVQEENKPPVPPSLQTLPTHTLSTIQDLAVLQLEAAHSQKYTFHTSMDNKSIGPYPYVTTNNRQTDEFRLDMFQGETETGSVLVAIYSCKHERYLKASDESSAIEFSSDKDEATIWRMIAQADGSYVFCHSQQKDTVLSTRECSSNNESEDCELCTKPEDDTCCRWRLEPCMPRAISSSKIRTFAIGTSVAIGTTIAMPFAVAGVVGLMGAEMGILAQVVAAGLTGAEALASIGVVGTTAALVFREDAKSVSVSVDGSAEEESQSVSKMRPFCDWRCWL